MATKAKHLTLSRAEFEVVYRMHVSAVPEDGVSHQRQLNDLLDQMETVGDPLPLGPEEMAHRYTTKGGEDVELVLSSAEESTFTRVMREGVKRFQAWVGRPVPGLLDRLSAIQPTVNGGPPEAGPDEGDPQ